MCGIAGLVTRDAIEATVLDVMHRIQSHRGPDATGSAIERVGHWSVGLAHQRLSIIDLSEAANQPMRRGGDLLIFNGEIYNYIELREELLGQGVAFTTQSDSEVLMAAFRHWGVEGALRRFNGMWGLAWLDTAGRRLVFARDRAGVKPFHYALRNGNLYFASEAKTILATAGGKFSLNMQVVGEYLLQSLQDTTSDSFFEGIVRLPPAHFATVDLSGDDLTPRVTRYWAPPDEPIVDVAAEAKLIERVRELVFDAVRIRLRSDVPVGVLLSGGLDSSSIVAAMHGLLGPDARLNILSAVSKDARFDESPFIDMMSAHIGRQPSKVMLDFTPREAFDYLEQVCWHNDEPVGAFASVAHYLLMKRARDLGVTVVLSGQGADELLCGYKKYLGFYLHELIRGGHFVHAASVAGGFWRRGTIINQFKINEAKRYLPDFLRPSQLDMRGGALRHSFTPVSVGMNNGMTVTQRQRLDFERLSIPLLTHHEDRMSMAWGREIRVPFLDYRLVELLLPLPTHFKLRDGWTKYILRKAMEPHLPPEIVWRKDKQGFINPEGEWLKHHLRSEVETFLSPDRAMYRRGIVDRVTFARIYETYRNQPAGKGLYWFKDIFNPLALEVFLERYELYLN